MINITQIRHTYPEVAGFTIDRKTGYPEYTFLHFYNSVKIRQNDEIITTEPHAIILYDIDAPQYFESPNSFLNDWIHFKGDIGKILKDSHLELNKVYYPSRYNFITELIQEIESEYYANRTNSEQLIQLKSQEFFLKLDRAIFDKPESDINAETRERFRHLRGKVFSSLEKQWTVAMMANEVSLSESWFYTVYKAIYGISPTADLINARINAAKNILIHRNEKVDEIALLLGYQNTTHFIRQFKKIMGMSPTNYRKNMRKI